MARLSRTVLPGHPHHVTQRGVRSMDIFADDHDSEAYLEMLRDSCTKHGVEVITWCLMTNHVHFIVIPDMEDSLSRSFGEAHKAYTRMHNFRQGVRGYLFQGKFGSYVMDEAHLLSAVRYVLRNPVKAGLTSKPEKWRWSSAKYHYGFRKSDPLVRSDDLMGLVSNWRGFMRETLSDTQQAAIDLSLSTGRPLGNDDFMSKAEAASGRRLVKMKSGWTKGKSRKKK